MFKSSKKKLIISGCSYTHNYAKTVKLKEFPIWGELLADQLNMELINLSRCGFGNRAIYMTLVDRMIADKNVGFVVAMWSEFQRTSWYIDIDALDHADPRRRADSVRNPWRCFLPERIIKDVDWHDQFYKPPGVNPKKKAMKYQLGKMIRDFDLDSLVAGAVQSLGYMFAFQNICEYNNIPYLQLQGCWPALARSELGPGGYVNKKLASYIIESSYLNKISDNFIGWPIIKNIGGHCCDNFLTDSHRIGEGDTHPNENGHKLMNKVLYDEYKKIYS